MCPARLILLTYVVHVVIGLLPVEIIALDSLSVSFLYLIEVTSKWCSIYGILYILPLHSMALYIAI